MEDDKKVNIPTEILRIYGELTAYRTKEFLVTISEDEALIDASELRTLVSLGVVSRRYPRRYIDELRRR